ncbi:HSP20-like chaperone [Echria macrotheca]|uniref:HSP20-like chaperone n=1 Tax=Echria macrotheca TaxID=438768 RepID=A0AAJ0BQK6_9PEZI|nr:HSP20-like chaperone [Echria macrotheca]
MAASLIQNLPNRLASSSSSSSSPSQSRHLTFTRTDGLKTTIIPPLSLSPPPISLYNPSQSQSQSQSQQQEDQQKIHFSPETLSHFLHAFHTHYGYPCESTTQQGTTTPNFDLVESRTGYTIYGELPGLKRDDVSVETNDLLFTITISGTLRRPVPSPIPGPSSSSNEPPPPLPAGDDTRDDGGQDRKSREGGGDEEDDEELHWHVEERHIGRFRRVFHLPIGLEDMACVKATMRDGLLCVTVPKTVAEMYREEISQRRSVEVEGSEGRSSSDMT